MTSTSLGCERLNEMLPAKPQQGVCHHTRTWSIETFTVIIICCLGLLLCLVLRQVSCIQAWPQTYYVAEDDFELLILSPPFIDIIGNCNPYAWLSGCSGIEDRL